MKLNPDDPRLTAYALGELSGSEKQIVEAALQASPECRQVVEEIQQTAKALSDQLAAEPNLNLRQQQRQQIDEKLQPDNVVPLFRRRTVLTLGISALAACLVGVLIWQSQLGSQAKQKAARLNTETKIAQTLPPRPQPTLAPARPRDDTKIAAISDNQQNFYDANWSGENQKSQQLSTLNNSDPNSLGGKKDDTTSVSIVGWLNVPQPQSAPATPLQSTILYSDTASLASGESSTVASDGLYDKKLPGFSGSLTTSETPSANTPAPGQVLYSQNSARGSWNLSGQSGPVPGAATAPETSGRPLLGYRMIAQENEDVSDRWRSSESRTYAEGSTATYPHLTENSFLTAVNFPLSTFSIDVDTASYANVRRFLSERRMPSRDAVRIEEMINYFSYRYPQPRGEDPFAANIEVAGCPWNPEHRLVRIGIKGREIAREKRPPSNFVFLIDVSGSMQPNERLPLIKQALRQLVKKMTGNDRVAIVVYASEAGIKLESTPCSDKETILRVIDELAAGGSTNGGDGIRQAYRVAEENFIQGGVNRVLLCTDGDFNVGTTDQRELVQLIQQKAKSGVFLTTLGVGSDNYKDALMQKLADKGNGNYHYLDTLEEAQKVLIDQMNATLVTIAKDVKIQIEFNPAQVNAYRLIGYEKRLLHKEDFNNDAKDAGEIGAGHTVTAFYEIVPAGQEIRGPVDDLKYQQPATEKRERYVDASSKELLTLKLRYKQPNGDRSRLLEFPVTDSGKRFANASPDFRFAASVASFGMLLRDSEYKGDTSYDAVREWASQAKGSDEEGYRAEFLNLVRTAGNLREQP
jgi:Ca-activated chloride channel family protein